MKIHISFLFANLKFLLLMELPVTNSVFAFVKVCCLTSPSCPKQTVGFVVLSSVCDVLRCLWQAQRVLNAATALTALWNIVHLHLCWASFILIKEASVLFYGVVLFATLRGSSSLNFLFSLGNRKGRIFP